MRAGGPPQETVMPPINPSPARPANELPLAQAFRLVRNPQPRVDCQCGQCSVNEAGFVDLAVDNCLMDALNLVSSMTNSKVKRVASDQLALHSLHGLLTHGRLMCCLQRYASQPDTEDDY
jgi:hypothetical protein